MQPSNYAGVIRIGCIGNGKPQLAYDTIRLWDVATWTEVADLRGHQAYVHALAFSPEGAQIVSSSGDFTVRLWDSLSYQETSRRGA
jgi:WD40 repeat protein